MHCFATPQEISRNPQMGERPAADECAACAHITDAFFYEELAKVMGCPAANEWLLKVRVNRIRNRVLQSNIFESKVSPSGRCTDPIRQSFSFYSPPTCDTRNAQTKKRPRATCIHCDAKDFNDLVLSSDTLPTPIEFGMLDGMPAKESKKKIIFEKFGLLFTDAAHVVLRDVEMDMNSPCSVEAKATDVIPRF